MMDALEEIDRDEWLKKRLSTSNDKTRRLSRRFIFYAARSPIKYTIVVRGQMRETKTQV